MAIFSWSFLSDYEVALRWFAKFGDHQPKIFEFSKKSPIS
jgi:hypothetical protein